MRWARGRIGHARGFILLVLLTVAISNVWTGAPGRNGLMLAHTASGWVSAILLVHIVAWLSLSMKRGAFPIGYVVNYGLHTVITIVAYALAGAVGFGIGSSPAFNFILVSPLAVAAVSIIATVILHPRILRRLETRAGES